MAWLFGAVGFVLVGVAFAPRVGVALVWRVSAVVWWVSGLVWLLLRVDSWTWEPPVLVGLLVGGVLAALGAGVAWLARGVGVAAGKVSNK
jgi:uncharacterized membrane-anchored protein YitT (DUF2179 family)